jgi:hypothetical protein
MLAGFFIDLVSMAGYDLQGSTVNIRQNWLSVHNLLPGDSLMDFSTLSLPDSCYGDLSHLNHKVAKLFISI